MNELDAGKARFQLRSQTRMLGEEFLPRGGPSRLQAGQILVQHANQFLARTTCDVGRGYLGCSGIRRFGMR